MEAGPQPLRQFLGEARFLAEWWTGRNRRYGLEGREGARGRTVLVIPGLLAADWMTRPLRRALESAGHEVHGWRSEEHTSELQSLMRISYAVFCLIKKNIS